MQQVAYTPKVPEIKLLLWRKKLSGRQLARRWGCHPATVSRVISGHIKDPAWLQKLAKALRVPLEEICDAQK